MSPAMRRTAWTIWTLWALVTVLLACSHAFAQAPIQNVPSELRASQNCSEVRGTGSQTATLTPPSGQYVYLASLEASAFAQAGTAGVSTPASLSSTNLNGITFGLFAGTSTQNNTAGSPVANFNYSFSGNGLKSSAAGTAVTVVAPSVTNLGWHILLCGYFAP